MKLKHKFNFVNKKVIEVKTVIVHSFFITDSDDPELYAAEPLYKWQISNQGQWVMEHAVETPIWTMSLDPSSYQYRVTITAKLIDRDYTFWTLKWAKI